MTKAKAAKKAKRPLLINPDELTLDPNPEPRKNSEGRTTQSKAVARAIALRAWKAGKRTELNVTHKGKPVTYGAVDWAKLPRTGGPAGQRVNRGASVQLSKRGSALLEIARELEGHTSDSATVEAALEMYSKGSSVAEQLAREIRDRTEQVD